MLTGNLKLYITLFALLALTGMGFLIKWQYSTIQELKASQAILEAKNEQITKQANRHANRPRTNDDVLIRLRTWGDAVKRSENQSQ